MVKVSPEIKAAFEKQRVIPMATADKKARPNVILVGMWYWADDETLVVSDNYLNKTKANLLENPVVAFNGWADQKSYQIKCKAEYLTSGPLFEEGRKRVEEFMKKNPIEMPGKAVWKLKVEELYFTAPGPNAGKRLA